MKVNCFIIFQIAFSFLFCIVIIDNSFAGENINETMIFIGQIEDISTLNDKPRFNRWHIEVVVNTIVSSKKVDFNCGDKVHLYLHGIVRIFGGLEKDIIGKTFRFILLDDFSENYSGRIIAEPIETKNNR